MDRIRRDVADPRVVRIGDDQPAAGRHGQTSDGAEPGVECGAAVAAEAAVRGAGEGAELAGAEVHLEHLVAGRAIKSVPASSTARLDVAPRSMSVAGPVPGGSVPPPATVVMMPVMASIRRITLLAGSLMSIDEHVAGAIGRDAREATRTRRRWPVRRRPSRRKSPLPAMVVMMPVTGSTRRMR